jgi:transcription-repair coupling factor (superfamily II helicase)
MQWYQRIAAVQTPEECSELLEELRDRYGPIPEPVENVVKIMKARVLAVDLGVKKMTLNKNQLYILFDTYHPITPERKRYAYQILSENIKTDWEEYPYLECKIDGNSEKFLDLLITYLEKLHNEGI